MAEIRCRWIGKGSERWFLPGCWGGASHAGYDDVDPMNFCTCPKISDAMLDRAGRLAQAVIDSTPRVSYEGKIEYLTHAISVIGIGIEGIGERRPSAYQRRHAYRMIRRKDADPTRRIWRYESNREWDERKQHMREVSGWIDRWGMHALRSVVNAAQA